MEDETELGRLLRRAVETQRGYAGFFGWPDKDVAEWGVASSFAEAAALANEPGFPLRALTAREPGRDPPDCEAVDVDGRRVAIEVTELVDPLAIQEVRRSHVPGAVISLWDRERLLSRLTELVGGKDGKTLHDRPYDEYHVLVHTDEPDLRADRVADWLAGHEFPPLRQATRAYLLMSYDPRLPGYPLFRLRCGAAQRGVEAVE